MSPSIDFRPISRERAVRIGAALNWRYKHTATYGECSDDGAYYSGASWWANDRQQIWSIERRETEYKISLYVSITHTKS